MKDPKSPLYRIRIRGGLGETLLSAFPRLEAETRSGEAFLSGTLPDHAALTAAGRYRRSMPTRRPWR